MDREKAIQILKRCEAESHCKHYKRHYCCVGCGQREALDLAIEALKPVEDMGEVSDGYHTFNQLYHQRAVLFATIVNQNKDKAWKSWKHEDGQFCFDKGGEWFIAGVDTPEGSYTYHYEKKYWDMFDCEELDRGKHWDGHTEEDVTRLLSLPPVTPTERTGEWIEHDPKTKGLAKIYECPFCDDEVIGEKTNYCPNCGAKMKGGTENEEEALDMVIEALLAERTGEWIENAPEGQDIDPPYICSICGLAESTTPEGQDIDPPYICSICGLAESTRTPFCEQCVAKMVGDTE